MIYLDISSVLLSLLFYFLSLRALKKANQKNSQ